MQSRLGSLRILIGTVVVLTGLLATASIASAQATLSGTVRDASTAVLPGVTVEAASPVLIEKVRSADHRRHRAVPHHRTAARHVHASRSRCPGSRPSKREGVEMTRRGRHHDQRRHARRRRAGNDHRHRRDAGRGRAEHARGRQCSATTSSERCRPTRGYGAPAESSVPGVCRAGERPTAVAPGDDVLHTPRRPRQRRARADRRHERRLRRSTAAACPVTATIRPNAAEMQVTLSGGLGEAETAAPTVNIVPKTGGNKFAGPDSSAPPASGRRATTSTTRCVRYGIADRPALSELGRERLARRADQARPAVVLRQHPRTSARIDVVPGAFANTNAGDATKWTYVQDRSHAGAEHRRATHWRFDPAHRAGHAAKQGRLLRRPAAAVHGHALASRR